MLLLRRCQATKQDVRLLREVPGHFAVATDSPNKKHPGQPGLSSLRQALLALLAGVIPTLYGFSAKSLYDNLRLSLGFSVAGNGNFKQIMQYRLDTSSSRC